MERSYIWYRVREITRGLRNDVDDIVNDDDDEEEEVREVDGREAHKFVFYADDARIGNCCCEGNRRQICGKSRAKEWSEIVIEGMFSKNVIFLVLLLARSKICVLQCKYNYIAIIIGIIISAQGI